jgi:hypothetical protein
MSEQHPGARPIRPRNRVGVIYVPNETLTAQLDAERALADDLAIGVDYLYEHGDARLLDAALARYREARS